MSMSLRDRVGELEQRMAASEAIYQSGEDAAREQTRLLEVERALLRWEANADALAEDVRLACKSDRDLMAEIATLKAALVQAVQWTQARTSLTVSRKHYPDLADLLARFQAVSATVAVQLVEVQDAP